jgi:hypothetical protein
LLVFVFLVSEQGLRYLMNSAAGIVKSTHRNENHHEKKNFDTVNKDCHTINNGWNTGFFI